MQCAGKLVYAILTAGELHANKSQPAGPVSADERLPLGLIGREKRKVCRLVVRCRQKRRQKLFEAHQRLGIALLRLHRRQQQAQSSIRIRRRRQPPGLAELLKCFGKLLGRGNGKELGPGLGLIETGVGGGNPFVGSQLPSNGRGQSVDPLLPGRAVEDHIDVVPAPEALLVFGEPLIPAQFGIDQLAAIDPKLQAHHRYHDADRRQRHADSQGGHRPRGDGSTP